MKFLLTAAVARRAVDGRRRLSALSAVCLAALAALVARGPKRSAVPILS